VTSQLRRRGRSGWRYRQARARAWRARAWRSCLLTAAVAALAGCVGMPNNGPATEFTASPPSSQPNNDFIGLFPSAPPPGGSPWQIVQGFLVASANYPIYAGLANGYLTTAAAKAYSPVGLTVLSDFYLLKQSPAQAAPGHREVSRATVQTGSIVQTTYGSSSQGQYFWPLNQGASDSTYTFDLVKVNGQWRISNPPRSRMLLYEDFQYYYQTRDLYFFGPQEEQTLVPNSVFVPLGTNEEVLVADLVNALSQDPKTPWLANAAVSQFPPQTKVLGVSVDGATATVNLGGAIAHASAKTLWEVSAQLVWTLASSTPLLGSIQSVVLELNGQPWTSRDPPCSGGPSPTAFQTLAAYQCYDPFPSAATSFYYVNGGQAWSRCGTETQARKGSIGTIDPLVDHTGAYSSPDCGISGPYLPEPQASQTPPQSSSIGPLAMASVSPDGKYLAVVPPDRGAVYIVTLPGSAASFPKTPRLTTTGISALSWDRTDDLWVAAGGDIDMVQPAGKGSFSVPFPGTVNDLSVAPDGIRIALIVADGPRRELEVASILQPQGPQTGLEATAAPRVGPGTPLAPDLAHPISLDWYNTDDLIVLNSAPSGNALSEVPVDGQEAIAVVTPPGAASITADGPANVLVAGLAGGYLAVSPGPEGPWQQLANRGQDPAYP